MNKLTKVKVLEKIEELINKQSKLEDSISKAYEEAGVDYYLVQANPVLELIPLLFDEREQDWVDWYLFESSNKAYIHTKEYLINTPQELFDFLELQ